MSLHGILKAIMDLGRGTPGYDLRVKQAIACLSGRVPQNQEVDWEEDYETGGCLGLRTCCYSQFSVVYIQ
jgi:hypothetical protein